MIHARVPHFSVKRIAGTFSAEVYGQTVALAVPIVQLPILLMGWGEQISTGSGSSSRRSHCT